MVCEECGVNTAIIDGHSKVCSQYVESSLSDEQFNELHGVDDETADKLRDFGNVVSDVVIDRGEKSLIGFLAGIGIHDGDPGFEELRTLSHLGLAIGAGICIQIMIEQDLLDQQAVRRAAGV
jgi:hypothetical protein